MTRLHLSVFVFCLSFFACNQVDPSLEQAPPAPPVTEQSAKAAPAATSRSPKKKEDASTTYFYDSAGDETGGTAQQEPVSFSSAVGRVQNIDAEKQLIRTADMKFRAPKVIDASLQIERIAQQNGGFVLQNNYQENAVNDRTRRISKDSVEQTVMLRPSCRVVVRVPYTLLDTTLRSIGRLAEVLDYRNLLATDVSLELMEQQLANLQAQRFGDAVAGDIAEKGDKLKDITAAREREFEARTAADIAKIERLKIEDRVRYSTVTIDIYEHDHQRVEIIGSTEPVVTAWRPGFFERAGDGLVEGWQLCANLIVGLLSLWPLWLVAGTAWLIWRRNNKRVVQKSGE